MSENSMKEKLEAIVKKAMASMNTANSLDALNEVRVDVLGKKGQLTAVLKGMKDVAPEELRQTTDFDFSEEGMQAAVQWLNEQYEAQKEIWENAKL